MFFGHSDTPKQTNWQVPVTYFPFFLLPRHESPAARQLIFLKSCLKKHKGLMPGDKTMVPVRKNQNWLPDIFNDFFDNDWMVRTNATAPAINVLENENSYEIEVAAPGMKKEDFKVHIDENGNLAIEMEKKVDEKEEKKNGHYLRREFSYSKFQQTMVLPDDVEREKISAKVEHGVLNVIIPKVEKAKPEDNKRVINIE